MFILCVVSYKYSDNINVSKNALTKSYLGKCLLDVNWAELGITTVDTLPIILPYYIIGEIFGMKMASKTKFSRAIFWTDIHQRYKDIDTMCW